MNETIASADVARRVADRLAPSLDPGLRVAVEQELVRDPLETPPQRVIEPVSLAAFVVSLASFGWTVYRDLKKDRDAAKADGRETEARLALLLREDESFAAGRTPGGMTSEQESLILSAVARRNRGSRPTLTRARQSLGANQKSCYCCPMVRRNVNAARAGSRGNEGRGLRTT
jgi:hypothetical protein